MKTEQFAVRTPNILTTETSSLNMTDNLVTVDFTVCDEVRAVGIIAIRNEPGYFGLIISREIDEEVQKELDTHGLRYNQTMSSNGTHLETHTKITSEALDALNIVTSVACETLSDKFLKSK